jgi:Uma2 family endonuclease
MATTTLLKPNSPDIPQWQLGTWEDYLNLLDSPAAEDWKFFFNRGYILTDMSAEGINHAKYCDLLTMIFLVWFLQYPEQKAQSMSNCTLCRSGQQGASPDKVLYLGEGIPQWQEGEPRRIDVEQWRVPDLVGEVGDTTLATDLDEKKRLYAEMGVPEYWVIDVRGDRIFMFRLQVDQKYQEVQESTVLQGLPSSLLQQALAKLQQETNITVAAWFAQQITKNRV